MQELDDSQRKTLATIYGEIAQRVRERWRVSCECEIRSLMDEDDVEVIGTELELRAVFRRDDTTVMMQHGGPTLTTGQTVAMAVLNGDPAADMALADYLQEEGLIPKPRPQVGLVSYLEKVNGSTPPGELVDFLDDLTQFAYRKRVETASKKFHGSVRTAEAWEMVEGLIGDLRRELFGHL